MTDQTCNTCRHYSPKEFTDPPHGTAGTCGLGRWQYILPGRGKVVTDCYTCPLWNTTNTEESNDE